MNQAELNQIAREIIQSNIYMTVGTTDKNIPWVAPVHYGVSDDYSLYFISQVHSLHSQHIQKNPQVAFAIYDSHQPEGTGNGIQGNGKAVLLPERDIGEALRWYKTTFIDMKPESFIGTASYRFYKIEPQHFYINDPNAEIDKRVEVFLA